MYFGMHTPGTPEASELLLLERLSGLLCCPRCSGLQLPLAHALLDRSDGLGLKVGGSAVEVGVGDNTVRVLGDRQGGLGKGGREGGRKGRWTKRGGARDKNDEKETRKRRERDEKETSMRLECAEPYPSEVDDLRGDVASGFHRLVELHCAQEE